MTVKESKKGRKQASKQVRKKERKKGKKIAYEEQQLNTSHKPNCCSPRDVCSQSERERESHMMSTVNTTSARPPHVTILTTEVR